MSRDNAAYAPDVTTPEVPPYLKYPATSQSGEINREKKSQTCSPRCRTIFLVFFSFLCFAYAVGITIAYLYEVYFNEEKDHEIPEDDKPVPVGEVLSNSDWGYFDVRTGAHVFWWLWYAIPKNTYKTKPLILWIQGGPGESGSGIGGFMEIGPYDTSLRYKKGNWAVHANLLIVDSPVGVGYSYVDNDTLLTQHTDEIIADLITFLKRFFNKYPEFKTIPFHVFGESYGGRLAPLLAKQMHAEIAAGNLECLMKGIVLGGPAVDLIDGPVATWGEYLYTMSIIEESEKDEYELKYQNLRQIYAKGNLTASSEYFSNMSNMIYSTGIDMYNVLTWNTVAEIFAAVNVLMNGDLKKALKIIPEKITWMDFNTKVYAIESKYLLAPVTDTVDFLLTNTSYRVTVYNGQLDVVVNSIGTDKWLKKLTWPGMANYYNESRTTMQLNPKSKPIGFKKSYDKFSFYWIFKSGHQVPHDAPLSGENMFVDILKYS